MGKGKIRIIIVAAALILIAVGYAVIKYDLAGTIMTAINHNTPLPVFMALWLILPFIGCPTGLFYILAGIKFGILNGFIITILVIPVHLIGSFFIARALRRPITKLIAEKTRIIPEVPATREIGFSFLINILPAPYTLKNYIQPLAGVSFKTFFIISWAVQIIQAAPIIILGDWVMDLNLVQMGGAVLFFAVLYVCVRAIEKKFNPENGTASQR